jgi:hypothetical protein
MKINICLIWENLDSIIWENWDSINRFKHLFWESSRFKHLFWESFLVKSYGDLTYSISSIYYLAFLRSYLFISDFFFNWEVVRYLVIYLFNGQFPSLMLNRWERSTSFKVRQGVVPGVEICVINMNVIVIILVYDFFFQNNY